MRPILLAMSWCLVGCPRPARPYDAHGDGVVVGLPRPICWEEVGAQPVAITTPEELHDALSCHVQGQSPVDWIGAPIDFTTHWVWTHASSPGLDHVVSVQDAGEDVVAGFCALPRGPAVDLAVVVPAPVRTVRVEDLGACEDLAQADLRRVVHFVPPCWSGEPVADGETLARAYRCAFTASIDASARVAWSRQWVHVTPRMPPTGYLDRVVDRRDEIVVKTKAGCPGGTERPTYDLALALDLPVRPVRFETAPRRRACPQVP